MVRGPGHGDYDNGLHKDTEGKGVEGEASGIDFGAEEGHDALAVGGLRLGRRGASGGQRGQDRAGGIARCAGDEGRNRLERLGLAGCCVVGEENAALAGELLEGYGKKRACVERLVSSDSSIANGYFVASYRYRRLQIPRPPSHSSASPKSPFGSSIAYPRLDIGVLCYGSRGHDPVNPCLGSPRTSSHRPLQTMGSVKERKLWSWTALEAVGAVGGVLDEGPAKV